MSHILFRKSHIQAQNSFKNLHIFYVHIMMYHNVQFLLHFNSIFVKLCL